MPAESHSVRDTAFMSDFTYSVPRRAFPPSATGSTPITKPCSKRYPSLAGAAGTESPGRSAGYRENTRPSLSYSAAATRWGSARRAERISLASPWLANANEAVLFAAMTRPSVDRFFSVVCRNATTWYVTNPADVSNSTRPLMRSSIAVSFCLIGQSRSDISTPTRGDDLCHPQQLGADRQVCRFHRLRVDLEPDAVAVGHEANHASPFGESVDVADREDRPVLEARERLLQARPVGPADEQDVARLDLVHALVPADLEWVPSQALITHGLVQQTLERIIPQNADDHRRVGVGKGVGRPIDELCEVEEKDRLQLVFRGPGVLRRQPRAREEQHRERERPRLRRSGERRAQKRHSTSPYTPRSISRRVADAPNSA